MSVSNGGRMQIHTLPDKEDKLTKELSQEPGPTSTLAILDGKPSSNDKRGASMERQLSREEAQE